jgi:cysteine desulfurase family protein
LIYLDNAATTFPKPATVISAVHECIESYCGNPGRGSHPPARLSSQKIFECREALSELIGLDAPENVIFTENTTHALNTVIKGFLKRGDHVLISDMEHNSVLRPVYRLSREGIAFDIFPTHPLSSVVDSVRRLIRKNTKMLICTHVPNISSAELPITELGELCREKNIFFTVDAAQSAGHLPINISSMNIDALCLPGHKGLYGIQGCGAFCLRNNTLLRTLTEGGNGVSSLEMGMPVDPPERYESGTLPTPSIVGLLEGIKEIRRIGINNIKNHENELWHYAYERLLHLGNITVYEPRHSGSVLLFNVSGFSSDSVASYLGERDICVRGGYHCSALGHRTLGTEKSGAVRLGFGMFNTKDDIDALASSLSAMRE